MASTEVRRRSGGLIAFYAAFAPSLGGPPSILAARTTFVIEGVRSLDRLYWLIHGVDERTYTGTTPVVFAGIVTLSGGRAFCIGRKIARSRF